MRLIRDKQERLDRALSIVCCLQPMKHGNNPVGLRQIDLPIVLGTTSGGMGMGEAYYRQAVATPLDHRHQPSRVVQYQAQKAGFPESR